MEGGGEGPSMWHVRWSRVGWKSDVVQNELMDRP